MKLESIAGVLVPLVPLLIALLGSTRGPSSVRTAMKHDAEVLKELPVNTSAHEALLEVIRGAATRLQEEQHYTRDMGGVALGVAGAIGFGYLTLYLAGLDDWWWKVLAVFTGTLWIVFFFGIFDSAQRRDRTKKKRKDRENSAGDAADV